jgi:hypothetical protein
MASMNTKVHCPNCHEELSEDQLKKLWAEYCGKQKSAAKAKAAMANGSKGGRPMTYFQDVYDAIPDCVEPMQKKHKEWEEPYIFDVSRAETNDPVTNGFDLRCEDVVWHCSWNGISNYIEITENGQTRPAIWRVNYAAKTAANRLVEDIHREKVMRLPENNAALVEKIYKQTGHRVKIKDILS